MKKSKKTKGAQPAHVECSQKNRCVPIKANIRGRETECALYRESVCAFCGASPRIDRFYTRFARNAEANAVACLGRTAAAELENAATARERCAWRKPEIQLVCKANFLEDGAKISVNTELRLHRGTKCERIYGYNIVWNAQKGIVLSCRNI